MKDLSNYFDAKVIIEKNDLIFESRDFPFAQKWQKSFEEGKYAYQDPKKGPEILYYGARYMENIRHKEIFAKHNFMFDLTIINAGKVGEEYIKTVGHYHGHTAPGGLSFPEVYEVISGKIEYLLQSEPDQNEEVDVIWVVARAGDKIVMPPGWGHVSMNTGEDLAIETDLQVRDNPNDSDYSLFCQKVGGAYLRSENKHWPNPKYKIRSFRRVRPKEKPEWSLTKGKTLYQSFIENPKKFDWLKNPQNYGFSNLYQEL